MKIETNNKLSTSKRRQKGVNGQNLHDQIFHTAKPEIASFARQRSILDSSPKTMDSKLIPSKQKS
jgi:hypothetical protein